MSATSVLNTMVVVIVVVVMAIAESGGMTMNLNDFIFKAILESSVKKYVRKVFFKFGGDSGGGGGGGFFFFFFFFFSQT